MEKQRYTSPSPRPKGDLINNVLTQSESLSETSTGQAENYHATALPLRVFDIDRFGRFVCCLDLRR
jgi:hypothetical protein